MSSKPAAGAGIIFINNLAPAVDNKLLFDTFSTFGNILSCKIATDDTTGASKGYGYVHYETQEAAQEAIEKVNGKDMEGSIVQVSNYIRRMDRPSPVEWTNLYVKQFPESWDEEQLKALFTPFGALASVSISKSPEGKSKGFGFVNFVEHAAADAAVADLLKKQIEDPNEAGKTFELYVSRAQKKVELSRDIKNKLDTFHQERSTKFSGMNLYVKNLAENVTEEYFREQFTPFGTITSIKIMKDDAAPTGPHKGFGFVCYSSPEEATRAVSELNNKILNGKPIVVALHQRKELRRAHLAATYAPRSMRFPPGPAGMQVPYGMGMYGPQPGQANFPPQQRGAPFQFPGSYPPRGTVSPRGMPGVFNVQQPPRQNLPFNGYMPQQQGAPYGMPMTPQGMQQLQQQQQFKTRMMGAPMQGPGPVSQDPRVNPQLRQGGRPMPNGPQGGPQMPQRQMGGARGMPMGGNMPPMAGPAMGVGGRPGPQGGVKFNSQVRNQGQMPQQGMMQQGPGPLQGQQAAMPMHMQDQGPLDDQALAQADPQQQKNMIGERLYPQIYQYQPSLAGKITGMLLEMDNAELLNLLESPDALSHKIDEALTVLKNHATESENQ